MHGSNLLCYVDLNIKWRLGGSGALQLLEPIHPDCLAQHNAENLLAEQVSNPLHVEQHPPTGCRLNLCHDLLQDSVAYAPPLLRLPESELLYLEAWRGKEAFGSRVAIPVSMLLQVGPE